MRQDASLVLSRLMAAGSADKHADLSDISWVPWLLRSVGNNMLMLMFLLAVWTDCICELTGYILYEKVSGLQFINIFS